MNDISQGYVNAFLNGGIMTIEFFHPKGNALPGKLLDELAREIHAAGLHDEVKLIILRSAGEKTFCAGASFDELGEVNDQKQGMHFFEGFVHVINNMRQCPRFIIARVQGKCVGGGVGLAAAADYCIAMEGAEIKLSELAIGIGPFVIGAAVERKIGLSAFSQLAIDAFSWRTAEWAKGKGLFAEVHPTIESMDESIHRLSDHLSHANPMAMAEMKKMFWEGTAHWDHLLIERAAISGKLVNSEFTKTAIQKFKKG